MGGYSSPSFLRLVGAVGNPEGPDPTLGIVTRLYMQNFKRFWKTLVRIHNNSGIGEGLVLRCDVKCPCEHFSAVTARVFGRYELR